MKRLLQHTISIIAGILVFYSTGFSQCGDAYSITIRGGLNDSVFKASAIDNYFSQFSRAGDTSKNEISAFTWTNDQNGVHYYNGRSLLWFAMSKLPAGAVITSANLYLYPKLDAGNGVPGQPIYGSNNAAYLERITTPWSLDSTNFNNQPLVSDSDKVVLPQSSSTNQRYIVNVTGFVKRWINNPESNYGMLLRMQTENNPYNSMLFESGQAPDSTKPKLVISYIIPSPDISQVTIVGDTSSKFQTSLIDNYSSQLSAFGDTGKTYLEAFTWTNNSHNVPLYNGRTLIKYDVSEVPANSTIVNAYLYLYAKKDNTNGVPGSPTYGSANTGLLQKVTGAWNITNTNYDNEPPVASSSQKTLNQSVSTTQNYVVNITDFVQSWVNKPDSNFGMLLRMKVENNPYNSLIFESAHAANPSQRPKIVICYRPTSALPLVLDNFEGAVANANANLLWTTHNEIGMKSIEIQRSYDGSSFLPAGTLPAQNHISVNKYNYIDYNLQAHFTSVYYRLKLINLDGSSTYSKTLMLNYFTSQNDVYLFPNPVKSYTQLSFTSKTDEDVYIKITDVSGKTAILQSAHFLKGSNKVVIQGLEKLTSGLYILQTTVNGKPVNKKLIVQ